MEIISFKYCQRLLVIYRFYQGRCRKAVLSKSVKNWLPSVNRKFFVRDLATIEKESTLGNLTVIIEFPSKEDAVSAYESEEYQKMISLRTPYSDLTLTIFEGV